MGLRLVATDLDGTIVRRDQSISPRTVKAFHRCAEAGIEVVFVTGRPPRWLSPVADATGSAGTAVCANGAIVYDLATERITRIREVPRGDVREVVRRMAAALPGLAVAFETREGFRREPEYQTRFDTFSDQDVGTLDELLADDPGVVKILLRHAERTSDQLLAVGRPLLEGLAEATHANSRDNLLEVSARGVSKASALAELAAERGIDAAEVVAFGDMPNDLAMLAWAGRGYAMAGGHPDTVAAADAVAPPCDEDGVAQVLEELLDGG
jgi:Cof subfamily protein (haloacid dehalogenase superfamily)